MLNTTRADAQMVTRLGADAVATYDSIMKMWRYAWLAGIVLLGVFVVGQASQITAVWGLALLAFFCVSATIMTMATLRMRSLVSGILRQFQAPKKAAHRLTLRVLRDPVAFDRWRSEFAGKGDLEA